MDVRAAKNHLQETDSRAEGSIALTKVEVTAVISVMQCFTAGKGGKRRAGGRGQRAKSKERRAKSKERRAEGREQRAKGGKSDEA